MVRLELMVLALGRLRISRPRGNFTLRLPLIMLNASVGELITIEAGVAELVGPATEVGPKRLSRPFVKLSSCAWTCLKAEAPRLLGREDVVPGMLAAIQTQT